MLGAAFCLIGVCIVAIVFKVLDLPELPSTFIGATLGAAITGTITLFLLSGQTESQEVKERNMKVFENKSKIFEAYIKYIWEVWKDRYLSPEEYETLIAKYCSKVMIYIKDKNNLAKMTECLLKLAESGDNFNITDNRNSNNVENLRENLFGLINILSAELGVGGEINKDDQIKLENRLIPVLFKKTLLRKMEERFAAYHSDILKTSVKYEQYPWIGARGEFISINFIDLRGIKIMIGPFNGPIPAGQFAGQDGAQEQPDENIGFRIYIDPANRDFNEYRLAQGGHQRPFIRFKNENRVSDQYLNKRMDSMNSMYAQDNMEDTGYKDEIWFHFPKIDKYKENIELICDELADRAEFAFNNLKIANGGITIEEFYLKCKELIIKK